MKKLLLAFSLLFCVTLTLLAQNNKAEIKFNKTTCSFTFTNVGSAPLIINQAVASCGCTIPTYTKTPIKPGESGEIVVTYNGTGKFPGLFKKTVTVRTNATTEMTRLYIEGEMEAAK